MVYDRDTFFDDEMGDAEIDVCPFLDVVGMVLKDQPSGNAVIRNLIPNRENCLSEESSVEWVDGKVVQNMILRLHNVECGEVELQLQWIDTSGSS